MCSKNSWTHIVALICLAFAGWCSLATSSPKTDFASGSFHVKSDCVSPVLEADVALENQSISAPAGPRSRAPTAGTA